jgi:NitT/TauT family transport system ATP-binding protein
VNGREDTLLEVAALSHRFGGRGVLFEINLHIHPGQIVALVGPSGCGKSTLLNTIVGTLAPTQGQVLVHGRDAAGAPVSRPVVKPDRDRGIVYQRYALFPFLTARQNVAYGLMFSQVSLTYRVFLYPLWRRLQKQHFRQAEEFLAKMDLAKAIDLYPSQMSGGMCQRVAIAQTLIMKPKMLLLDEPFGALDEATREEMQMLMRGLATENREAQRAGAPPPHTVIIVTHEINEGLFVSDRVLGLSQYWDWKGEGFADCPGATVVYDQPSPVYELKETRDFERFKGQKQQIIDYVFEDKVRQPRWDWVQASERLASARPPPERSARA